MGCVIRPTTPSSANQSRTDQVKASLVLYRATGVDPDSRIFLIQLTAGFSSSSFRSSSTQGGLPTIQSKRFDAFRNDESSLKKSHSKICRFCSSGNLKSLC